MNASTGMRVIVMGAAGFLGARLVARLAAQAGVGERVIDELVRFDLRPLGALPRAACRVVQASGDLRDPSVLDGLFARPVDVVFHLAATLTLDAETAFRRGLETNVLGFIELLEHCRAQPVAPMLLFASSISTFGGQLPATVGDDVFQAPTTSYGTHKAVAEQLLADYTRHGFVDGRALRLPIVLTHPGPATGSISDQLASLIREPLRGLPTSCRFAPGSRMAVASVDKVVDAFMRLAALPAEALHEARTMNLPGLTVTPAGIAAAVARRLPGGAPPMIEWRPDSQVQHVVDAWPASFTSARALRLGFEPDACEDDIVSAFLRAEGERS